MLLRPGNAGSNTFTDHKEVLAAALKQVPSRFRRQDPGPRRRRRGQPRPRGAPARPELGTAESAVHDRVDDHRRRRGGHRLVPADAWKPGTGQDGAAEDDKDVAEITHLLSRAENWPDGLRFIVRRVKPSRRQARNLTAFEKKTGWRYSVICTNIPDAGIAAVPGSHHPQFIDVLHRDHACVETAGVRTAKSMGLRNLPSKTWQVNCRLGHRGEHRRRPRRLDPPPRPPRRPRTPRRQPGHAPLPGLAPPRQARPPRPPAHPRHQRDLAMGRGVPGLLAAALRPASTRLTSTNNPSDTEGGPPRRGRSRCAPGIPGTPRTRAGTETDMRIKNGNSTISNRPSVRLND